MRDKILSAEREVLLRNFLYEMPYKYANEIIKFLDKLPTDDNLEDKIKPNKKEITKEVNNGNK